MSSNTRLGRRGAFWASALVLALCLWASGAPSVLYPVYAAEWGLPAVVTTSVFAAYPLALLVVLALFGGVSDTIGRRRAMLLGVALIAVAAVAFAVAPNVLWLYAGRILQGVGTGFALGAASASLVEHNVSANPRFASSVTGSATASGLTLALLVSGVLAEFAPLPLVLSFAVLFVLGVAAFVLVWRMPDDTAGLGAPNWRPRALRLAPGLLRPFLAATLSVSLAYSIGAVFLSLGAQMARDLTGTSSLAVTGALLAISAAVIGVVSVLLARVPAHASVLLGGGLSLASLAVMAACAIWGSVPLFLAWCVVGGVAYAFAFTGGIGVVNRAAPAQHRGATLSLMYLFSYLLQALTAIGAGALATGIGLEPAIDVLAPLLGVLALGALAAGAADVAAARRVVSGTLSTVRR